MATAWNLTAHSMSQSKTEGFCRTLWFFAHLPESIAIYQKCNWWKTKTYFYEQTANTHQKKATLFLWQGTGGISKSWTFPLPPTKQWTHTSDEQRLPSSRYAWSRFCSCLIVTPAGNTSFWSLTGGPFFAARWPEAVCCWITVGYELGLNLCAWLTWGWLGLATLDVKFSQHMMCWNSWWLPHLSCWLVGE